MVRKINQFILVAFVLACSLPARDAMATDEVSKNVAIWGTVATWFTALMMGENPFTLGFRTEMESTGVAFAVGRETAKRNNIDFREGMMTWQWRDSVVQRESWRMRGAWEANLSYWDAGNKFDDRSLFNLGVVPVFRYEPSSRWAGVRPYIEFGIGPQLITETRIGDRIKSTAFQFRDLYGVGVQFGEREQFRLGYRFIHVSNADIKKPNNAVDFRMLVAEYRF